jgi:hypothetical protein
VILAVLLSSTKRTATARLPVFAVLSVNWTLERMVVLTADLSDSSAIAGVHARLWLLRRLALLVAVGAAVRAAWRHVDSDKEMRESMRSVRELSVEIRSELRRQSSELLELKRAASISPVGMGGGASGAGVEAGPAARGRRDSPPSTAANGSPPEDLASRSPVVPLPFALEGNEDDAAAQEGRTLTHARARSAFKRAPARRDSTGRTPIADGAKADARARRGSGCRAKSPAPAALGTARATRSASKRASVR